MEPESMHFTHFLGNHVCTKVREVIRVVNRCSDIVSCKVMRNATKRDNSEGSGSPEEGHLLQTGQLPTESGTKHGSCLFQTCLTLRGQVLAWTKSCLKVFVWFSPGPLSLPCFTSLPYHPQCVWSDESHPDLQNACPISCYRLEVMTEVLKRHSFFL